jgi:hypothetical protein
VNAEGRSEGTWPQPFVPTAGYPYLDGTGDLETDMWLRPNRALTDVDAILSYAITFDGYGYAETVLGRQLLQHGEKLRRRWHEGRGAGMSFVELRLLLFFTQRAWRFTFQGGEICLAAEDGTEHRVPLKAGPDDQDAAFLCDLHLAICDAWEWEWPHRRRQGGGASCS